jgi:fumarate hydratase, class II
LDIGDLNCHFGPAATGCAWVVYRSPSRRRHHPSSFSVEGTRLNRKRIDEAVGRSLMLVTALSPIIGYDKASAIAHKANDDDLTLREAALQSGYIDAKRFDEIVDPKKMTGHGLAGA